MKIATLLFLLLATPTFAASLEEAATWPTKWGTFKGFKGGEVVRPWVGSEPAMPYRFFAPSTTDPINSQYDPNESLPLVVYLSGKSGNGFDNKMIVKDPARHPGATIWLEPWMQELYKTFVLVPQTNSSWGSASTPEYEGMMPLVYLAINDLSLTYNIDLTRVYIMGHSQGGIGALGAAYHRPGVMAGTIASASTLGDKTASAEDLANIASLAQGLAPKRLWIIHGEIDPMIPVASSDAVYEELKDRGLNYTRIDSGGHGASKLWSWPLHENQPNAELYDWLFSKTKPRF